MSSEKAFERKLRATSKEIGYLSLKLNPNWIKGIPDRLFVGPNKTIVFMELKTPIGRASALQKYYIQKLKEFGYTAEFVDNYDTAIEILVSSRLSEEGHQDASRSVSGWPILGSGIRQD